jgi:hypothetical protein
LAVLLEKPKANTRKQGGDDSVERDGMGRPRILVTCPLCQGTGKVPSTKREGALNKCIRCAGAGSKKESFTRVTTFIDVLDAKDALMDWKARMVLKGVAMDTGFLTGVGELDPNNPDERKQLSARAEAAAELAGASQKSEDGTRLHELSELVDRDLPLPAGTSIEDYRDMEAYRIATVPFNIVHMEQLVVLDQFKCAGTPDRVSSVLPGYELIAPDGEVIGPDELLITDLKTGRIDYGALKMAMQLSIYSRSNLYNKVTGEREYLGDVNPNWGIIMHLPVGSAVCTLHWADLSLGWEAVHVAADVRQLRSRGRKALTPVGSMVIPGCVT